jgi:hypothetical protein
MINPLKVSLLMSLNSISTVAYKKRRRAGRVAYAEVEAGQGGEATGRTNRFML